MDKEVTISALYLNTTIFIGNEHESRPQANLMNNHESFMVITQNDADHDHVKIFFDAIDDQFDLELNKCLTKKE